MTVNHHDIVISRRDFLQGNEMETRWKQCIIIFQKCPKMSKKCPKNVQKMKLFNPEFLKKRNAICAKNAKIMCYDVQTDNLFASFVVRIKHAKILF